MLNVYILITLFNSINCYWDLFTSTPTPEDKDRYAVRMGRWHWEESPLWRPTWGAPMELQQRIRAGDCVVGLTIGMRNIGPGTILNKRVVITSANLLDPYQNREEELRIWALGIGRKEYTPYRYRVWRVTRILPRSSNPEHLHGPNGRHCPRHDVAIVHSWDQMHITYHYWSQRVALKATLCGKHDIIGKERYLVTVGSAFKDLKHIAKNYMFKHSSFETLPNIINCEYILPKWWGKFICIKNIGGDASTPTGGPLITPEWKLYGIGCFAINVNDDRYHVFTDLRFYNGLIHSTANYTPGEYYEYAYPEFGYYIPMHSLDYNVFPLG